MKDKKTKNTKINYRHKDERRGTNKRKGLCIGTIFTKTCIKDTKNYKSNSKQIL